MWENPINKKNVKFFKSVGVEFIGPKIGKLKCGEFGEEELKIQKYC